MAMFTNLSLLDSKNFNLKGYSLTFKQVPVTLKLMFIRGNP